MKKILSSITLASALVLSIVSCEKSDIDRIDSSVKFTVYAQAEEEKTYITTGAGGTYPVLWGVSSGSSASYDEKMTINYWTKSGSSYNYEAYSVSNALSLDPEEGYQGQPQATFTFSTFVPDTFDPSTSSYNFITGYYPSSAVAQPDSKNISDFTFTLPLVQNAPTDSYDPSAYIMVAKPKDASKGTKSWRAFYRRAVALNRITLTNLPAAVTGLTEVTFTMSGKYISGNRSIDLSTGYSNPVPSSVGENNQKVTVKFSSSFPAETNPVVYFCTWGALLTGGDSIEVSAKINGAFYNKTFKLKSTGKINFEEGSLNLLTLNMSGAQPTGMNISIQSGTFEDEAKL